MKYLVVLSLVAAISSGGLYAQNKMPVDTCGLKLSEVSYFWKQDSLGHNGYRYEVYKRLLTCRSSEMTVEKLKKYLGNPNIISPYTGGVSYVYYYFDGKTIPKNSGLAPERGYIAFDFDKDGKKLLFISDGHYD
jgi:hypothetical protein